MHASAPPTRHPVTQSLLIPRLLIITDHYDLGRALEHHVSVVWPEAECRIHAPLHSGRLHSAFTAAAFDVVMLDECVEHGRGQEWLDNLLHRDSFPPIVYLSRDDDSQRAADLVQRGVAECMARERIDHRRLSMALRESLQRRRQELALLRASSQADELARFGAVTIRGHRFGRELASGGMAKVYLGESERAGEMVVLKVLSDAPDNDESLEFARFLQEYELISKIHHPNVVRIHDLGIADDHAYIAMEYFPRGDLRAYIAQGIEPATALRLLDQLAAALEAVHAVGVLHRDLKPGNVMVREDGSLALIDFGLAKQAGVKLDMTGTGVIFGTPYYMSPEQGHGRPVDERSDLYGLGVMFYEMLTAKKPFVATTPMNILYLHANAPRPVLEGELQQFQSLLDGMIAIEPEARFASATALRAEIARLQRNAVPA